MGISQARQVFVGDGELSQLLNDQYQLAKNKIETISQEYQIGCAFDR